MSDRDQPHVLRAELHALLGAGPTADELDALHREARRVLGAAHEVTLTVEYHLAAHRDLTLAADDSVSIAIDLWDRVRVALPADHRAHRAITSHLVRCLSRGGRPEDLDQAVALRCDQLDRHAYGSDPEGIGTARLYLAAALLERGRFGWLSRAGTGRELDADLVAARQLIESELDRRSGTHGPTHPYTWQARALRCPLLVALAQDTGGAWAGQALGIAEALIRYDWERAGCHTVDALHAQLWRAEALLLVGRPRAAEGEARLASFLASRYTRREMGNALLVLARTLAGRDQRAARAAADLALTIRRTWCAADGYHVAEAHLLVERLRRGEGHVVKAVGATAPGRRCRTSARPG
jgi:hypothetical protein